MNSIHVDADLTLNPADFTTVEDFRLPAALMKILVHLGATCFQLDQDTGEFLPSADALEICKIIERNHGVAPANLDAAAQALVMAAKAAYDAHVEMVTKFPPGTSFVKALP